MSWWQDADTTGGRVSLTATEQTSVGALLDPLGPRALTILGHGGVWYQQHRVWDRATELPAAAELLLRLPPGDSYPAVVVDPNWICYEDHELLALDKPAGVYTVETPWDTLGNLRAALLRFLTARDGGTPYLHPAHRLDRDTSGVLLFAKTPHVNPALQVAFAGKLVQKTYLARTLAQPPADVFRLETGHGRERFGRFRSYPLERVGEELPGGGGRIKPMVTRFTVLRRDADGALLAAHPETGRTHQIRLHLAEIGCPLVGDVRYGGPDTWRGTPAHQHLLHAHQLSLPHPRTEQPLTITAAAPAWADNCMLA